MQWDPRELVNLHVVYLSNPGLYGRPWDVDIATWFFKALVDKKLIRDDRDLIYQHWLFFILLIPALVSGYAITVSYSYSSIILYLLCVAIGLYAESKMRRDYEKAVHRNRKKFVKDMQGISPYLFFNQSEFIDRHRVFIRERLLAQRHNLCIKIW